MSGTNGQVRVEHAERVAVITIDRPQQRNALSFEISEALAAAVADAEHNPEIGAIVISGEPPAFCAGADLHLLSDSKEEGLRRIYAGFLAVAYSTLPTVAAVDGAAVGAGLNLALACDVRLASPRARFDARFLQLGIAPGGGMTWMLHRAVGPQVAKAMALFGEVLDADEAERLGLTLRTVPGDRVDLLKAAIDLAAKAAGAPRELVITSKQTMHTTSNLPTHPQAVETELTPQLASMESPEFAELVGRMKARISGVK
ncbi:enoyl-CoA hydratase [Pseudonocardiaceae bacterium YIM PH 21723]|nr:enoyl-CoA hydratase [Pseudonocardiaceae bacterium YIM PH 21723]